MIQGIVYYLGEVAMASALDVLQLTLFQTYLSQTCLNVFYYQIVDEPSEGYLDGLISAFQETVLANMANWQPSAVAYNRIEVLNLFTGDLAIESTLTPNGGGGGATPQSGEPMASFAAVGFTLRRMNARVRNGRKSVVGVTEGSVTGNEITAGFAGLGNIAIGFGEDLAPGLSADVFRPIIVGRIKYEASSGRDAYRLPVTLAEMSNNWSYVADVDYSTDVTTMNSRKKNRGI